VVGIRVYSSRRTAGGVARRPYSAREIDAIAAYCPEVDTSYFIPFEEIDAQYGVQLRLRPAVNNQQRRVRWASQFEFAATLPAQLGAVAQLGERRHGMAEVTGSSPVGSTLFT
jgi:hypothetical protein